MGKNMDWLPQMNTDDLPYELDHFMILELWELNYKDQSKLEHRLLNAVISEKLKGSIFVRDEKAESGLRRVPHDEWMHINNGWYGRRWVLCAIHKSELLTWSINEHIPVPENTLLYNWIHGLKADSKYAYAIVPKKVHRWNDCLECMHFVANKFKDDNGRYPNKSELWRELLIFPLEKYRAEVVNENNRESYLRINGRILTKNAAYERYETLFSIEKIQVKQE